MDSSAGWTRHRVADGVERLLRDPATERVPISYGSITSAGLQLRICFIRICLRPPEALHRSSSRETSC